MSALDEAVFTSEDKDVALTWGREAGTLYETQSGVDSICVSSDMQIVWQLGFFTQLEGPNLWAWFTGWSL